MGKNNNMRRKDKNCMSQNWKTERRANIFDFK